MSISELIKKALSGESLSEEETKFLESYEEPKLESKEVDVDKVVQSRLAREKKKHDKEKSELLERLEELEGSLAEAQENDSTSDLEKAEKKLQRLQEKLEKQGASLAEREAALVSTQKNAALKDIKASLKLVSHADQEFIDYTLNKLTGDMDAEEIKESSALISEQFIESHPTLIRAEGSGTGIPASTGDGATQKSSFSKAEIEAMTSEEFLANEASIQRAMAEGKID